MNELIEKRIFGYIDPYPPVPESWKDEVFRFIERVEKECPEMLDSVIDGLSKTQQGMLREIEKMLFGKGRQ